jgi:hypothetical protein
MGDLPAPVNRGALERVLARAAELQAASGDLPEAFTESQLVDVGKEVGLLPEHVRQALAEERARGEPAGDGRSLGTWVFGAARVAAQRVIPGTPAVLLAALDAWMRDEEWLRVVRQRPDRMVWEPRRDLLGGLRRAFGGRAHHLHGTTEVAGAVSPVDEQRSVVALSADLTGSRRDVIAFSVAGTTIGAVASGVLGVLGFMTAVAVLPALVAGAAFVIGSRSAHERRMARAQLTLEQVLDRLEQRKPQPQAPSLLKAIESALPRGL